MAGEAPSDELLQEWAVIEVDPELVYSTPPSRRAADVRQARLLRLLRQYTAELEAQQTRFNLALLGRLRELERRRGE